jgi:hypothetical protein
MIYDSRRLEHHTPPSWAMCLATSPIYCTNKHMGSVFSSEVHALCS